LPAAGRLSLSGSFWFEVLLPNDFILAARYGNGVKTVSRLFNKAVGCKIGRRWPRAAALAWNTPRPALRKSLKKRMILH